MIAPVPGSGLWPACTTRVARRWPSGPRVSRASPMSAALFRDAFGEVVDEVDLGDDAGDGIVLEHDDDPSLPEQVADQRDPGVGRDGGEIGLDQLLDRVFGAVA